MAKSSTSFSSENQPAKRKGRGRAERTKLLEAFKKVGKTEEGFYEHLVERAFNPEDTFAAKEVLTRLFPADKSTMPCVEFEFDETKSPKEKADQILKAASRGELPPDVAMMFIGAITSSLKIEEVTELKDRIEKLEAEIGTE